MDNNDLLTRYNYDSFIPRNFTPWMRFDKSPIVGQAAPDFPLWGLNQEETSIREIVSKNLYTIVEFGSFN